MVVRSHMFSCSAVLPTELRSPATMVAQPVCSVWFFCFRSARSFLKGYIRRTWNQNEKLRSKLCFGWLGGCGGLVSICCWGYIFTFVPMIVVVVGFFLVSYDFHEAAVAHCLATTRVTIATVLRTVFVRYTVGFQKHSIRVVAKYFFKKGKLKTRVQIGDRKW